MGVGRPHEQINKSGQGRTQQVDHVHQSCARAQVRQACLACGSKYVHSGGFCSRCYNLERKPKVEGKKDDELVAAVKAKLAETKQPKAKPAAKKRTASKTQPVTTDDALEANAELYATTAENVPFWPRLRRTPNRAARPVGRAFFLLTSSSARSAQA